MALTRFNATTPVRYDAMNKLCDEVEVADSQLLDKINVLMPKGVVAQDFDLVTNFGSYIVIDNNMLHKPPFLYGLLEVAQGTENGAYVKQTGTDVLTGITYTRTKTESGWLNNGAWKQIATTEKTEIEVPYTSGFLTYGTSKITINELKDGKLICSVQKTDGTNFAVGTHTVSALPVGFTSKYNISTNITTESPPYGTGYGHIYQNNVIIDLNTSCKVIKFIIAYEGE